MDIYNFHAQTGEFLGASKADANPLEPGEFLMPAHATTKMPPISGDNETAVFNGEEWFFKEDFRGTEYWLDDNSHHIITELGQTMPEHALSELPQISFASKRIGEFRDFMTFFTDEEQLAIVAATQTIPSVKLWYDKAMGGKQFSLDHPDTIVGMQALVSADLITKTRMDAVLASDFNY